MILTKERVDSIDLDSMVDSILKSGNSEEFLLIVPTNRKLRKLKKDFIDLSAGNALSSINIETLTTLSNKVFSEYEIYIPLSEASSSILISQSAKEIRLKYFKNYSEQIPYGTLERIKNVISEYKRHGITPEILSREAGTLTGSAKLKALDIAGIYGKYLEKCGRLNSFEIGDIYREIVRMNEGKFLDAVGKLFPGIRTVVMEGFDEFTILEIEIIDRLSRLADSKLFIHFDYYEKNDALFSHLDKCYRLLTARGFAKIKDSSPLAVSPFADAVKSDLFRKITKTGIGKFKDKISVITGERKEEEIALVAKEIKRLILKEHVQPERICVVFNLIGDFTFIVRDQFEQLGIPFNLTDRYKLEVSFPIIAVINLLEVAESDFYFKNIFKACTNKFLNIGEMIDLSNLIKVARDLKITIGYDNWENSIIKALAVQRNLQNFSDDEIGRLENYESALSDIRELKNLLAPLLKPMKLRDFRDFLLELIRKTQLTDALLEDSAGREEENIKAVSVFLETIGEVFELLKAEYGGDRKFDASEILQILKTISKWTRFNIKEKSNYGVQITNLEEIRGLKFDYLFICGLNDALFPTRYTPEIFFSGSFRKQEFIHQLEERYRFYQTLISWRKRLYLSYSKTDARQELVKSNFLSEFCELFETGSLNKLDYDDSIFSDFEFLIYLGMRNREFNDFKLTEGEIKLVDYIRNAIAINRQRIDDPFNPSVFNGYLLAEDNPVLKDSLLKFTGKEFSVSELEIYAKCPFKYFVERLLSIEDFEEPVEEIEAIELGSLLHAILYRFYTDVRRKGIDIKNPSPDNYARIEKLLFDIAEEEFELVKSKSPYTFLEREKIFGLSGDKRDSILFHFLDKEIKDDSGFLPGYFEVSFGRIKSGGTDEGLSSLSPVIHEGVKLRGKIDRIDINEEAGELAVVDYKSGGKNIGKKDMQAGLSLQLPVYLHAAGEILKSNRKKEYSPHSFYIYSLKFREEDFGKNKISLVRGKNADEIGEMKNQIQLTLNRVKEYVVNIGEGNFHLSKLEDRDTKVCNYCNLKTICRIQEVIP